MSRAATYIVSTYDSADDPRKDGRWTVLARGVLLWGLRPILRRLRGEGYSGVSIAVEREEEKRPGAGRGEEGELEDAAK